MTKNQLKVLHGFGYLLSVDSDPKTVKGIKSGYLTAIMYMSPAESAGYNVCPMAKLAGCIAGCLNTAGHGGMAKPGATIAPYGVELPDNNVQRARIARTRFFVEHRAEFFLQLEREIIAFEKRAAKRGLIPCIRLNGTSDLQFEKLKADFDTHMERTDCTIFERFETLQFYDYTKIYKRFERAQPANYHLSLSYSEANMRYAHTCQIVARDFNAALVTVVRTEADKIKAEAEHGALYVNGDLSDLRFNDVPGARVFLKAKGKAKKDTSGFVVDLI